MNKPLQHLATVTLLVGFLSLVFPGLARQGVVYCDDRLAKTAATCQNTGLWLGNGSLYLRFFSMGLLMFLVGILAVWFYRHFTLHRCAVFSFVMLGLVGVVLFSIALPPLVMFSSGDQLRYVPYAPTALFYVSSSIIPSLGLLTGVLIGNWIVHESRRAKGTQQPIDA